MAARESSMLEIGTTAPNFELFDTVSNTNKSLQTLKSQKATVILFLCNHCPYVIHINSKLVEIANNYIPKGISFVAISSNDIENYPEDSPEKMKEVAKNLGYPFPYLYDEMQDIAKAYRAECTPDLFVFDGNLKLVYRGQFDSSRPKNNEPVTGADLINALESILEGRDIDKNQIPSIGCGIKWKSN